VRPQDLGTRVSIHFSNNCRTWGARRLTRLIAGLGSYRGVGARRPALQLLVLFRLPGKLFLSFCVTIIRLGQRALQSEDSMNAKQHVMRRVWHCTLFIRGAYESIGHFELPPRPRRAWFSVVRRSCRDPGLNRAGRGRRSRAHRTDSWVR
jgi:hypothetical protein